MRPRFSAGDAQRAFDAWGADCGPGAIAAICNLTLDEVRQHTGDFERKRYTNPTLMWQVLHSIGVDFSYRSGHLGRQSWPHWGLARIQWEGPWTAPGANPRWAYRQTHWVGVSARSRDNIGIFDINAMGNGSGWCSLADWEQTLVPWILREAVPRASGGWFITHSVEVISPAEAAA